MSEHWKSTPKYWCKHCSIYVKDTPFEKKQHEATGKHQGNLRRFLNGIQKDHAKNEREKIQAKAEVDRLNRIAGTSSTKSSSGAASVQSFPKYTKATSTNPSAADQKRQWAQLEEMGISIPEHAKGHDAAPSDWQTVSQRLLDEPVSNADLKLNTGVRKRKFEDQEEVEDAGDTVVRRGWGSTTKTYPGSTPLHNDLDSLLAASMFKTKKDLKRSADEDTKVVLSSVAKSEPAVDDAGNDRRADLLSLKQATSVTASSTGLGASVEEVEPPVLDTSEIETTVPVFKKRRPKR